MTTRRRFLSGLAVAAAALAPTAQAAAQGPAPATRTPSTAELVVGANTEFNFGAGRAKETHTFYFALSPPLGSGQRIRPVVGDLGTDGRIFPRRNIGLGWRLASDRRTLKLVVTLDPTGVGPGEYMGEVALQGRGIATKQIMLDAKLRSRVGSEAVTFLLAFGAIFVGVAGGAVLKWLAEKGTVLQGLRSQLSYVAVLAQGANLPPQLRQELLAAEAALADFDLVQADEAVKRIVPRIRDITSIAEFLGSLRERVDQQREWIDRLTPLSAGYRSRLLRVVDQELQLLDDTLDGSWPDPDRTKGTRESLPRYISVFSRLLTEVDDPRRRQPLDQALKLLEQGQFEAAEEAMTKPPETAAAAETVEHAELVEGVAEAIAAGPAAGPPRPAAPKPTQRNRLVSGVRGFILRYAGFTTGALIAISVALLGMTLLYYPKETFGGALDWLSLILWGFGAQLTGFTLTQLGGKALGSGPKLTST